RTSTWLRRAASCERIRRLACACRTRSDPTLAEMASDWAVKFFDRFACARMVKIFKVPESAELAIMMIDSHEERQLGAAAGVRDWAGKPRPVVEERIPSC